MLLFVPHTTFPTCLTVYFGCHLVTWTECLSMRMKHSLSSPCMKVAVEGEILPILEPKIGCISLLTFQKGSNVYS